MSKAVRIQPDLQFIKDLQAVGGETLKKIGRASCRERV